MPDQVTTAEGPVGFVGPRPLRAGDLLFGRDRELTELTNLVVGERVVLLYSPSGAGKTSLLQAGLVARLRGRPRFHVPSSYDKDGRKTDQPVVIRVNTPPAADAPSNRYVRSTLLALESRKAPKDRRADADLARLSLVEYLAAEFPGPVTPAEDAPADGAPGAPPPVPVLIFDQFEEALTLDPADEDDKKAFFQDLGRAAADRSRWFVFAMREDHLAELDPYLGYFPRWLAARIRIDRLKREPAADAVKRIVDKAGYHIEATTAEALVDDLRTLRKPQRDGVFEAQTDRTGRARLYPTVEPLYVQVVGLKLLAGRDAGATVTRDDLSALGGNGLPGVDRVLAQYFADEVGAAVGRDRQVERWTRLWFDRALLNRDGRRVTSRETEADEYGVPAEVLTRLAERYVIRLVLEGGVVCYEIAHDRLAGAVRWDNLRWRRERLTPFERAAAVWANTPLPRPAELLVGGAVLAEGEAAARAGWLDDDETAFLVECRARRDRTRKWRAVAGLAALGLVVGLVWVQTERLERAQAAAVEQAERDSDDRLDRARSAVARQAGEVWSEQTSRRDTVFRRLFEADDLAAWNWEAPDYAGPGERPVLLADRAIRVMTEAGYKSVPGGRPELQPPLPNAETGLRGALQRLGSARVRVSDGPLRVVAVSPDGAWVAVGGDQGIGVWPADDLGGNPVVPLQGAAVTALAFDPDTTELLYATTERKLGVVRLRKRPDRSVEFGKPEELPAFESSDPIRAVHYLPAPQRPGVGWVGLTTAGGSGYLWPRTGGPAGENPRRLEVPNDGAVTALGFTPPGTAPALRRLYVGTARGTVIPWRLDPSGKSEAGLDAVRGAGSAVTALAVHPKATVLAAAGYQSGLRLWKMDPEDKGLSDLPPYERPERFIADSLAFHPNGTFLAAGTADQGVRLYKQRAEKEYDPVAGRYGPHTARNLTAWAFDPGGDAAAPVLVGGGSGGAVRVWALAADRAAPFTLPGSTFNATAVAVTPDHRWVVAVGLDGTLRRWELGRAIGTFDTEPRVFNGPTAAVAQVVGDPDGTWVAAIDQDGRVSTWDTTTFPPAPQADSPFRAAADGPLLLTDAAGGTIVTVLKADGRAAARAATDAPGVWARPTALARAPVNISPLMRWTPDGKWVVRLIADPADGFRPVVVPAVSGLSVPPAKWDDPPPQPAIAADARVVATFAGEVWAVWHVEPVSGTEGRRLYLPRATASPTRAALLASPDVPGAVHAALGPAALGRRTDVATAAAVGPADDGGNRFVAAGFESGAVGLWQVGSDRPELVSILYDHRGPVRAVAFSADGRRFATAGADAKVRVWDVPLADRRTPVVLAGHTAEVTALAFVGRDENLRLVSGGADGTVRLWTADPVRLMNRARALLNPNP